MGTHSIGMEYSDNEVCSEGKPVNVFEYDDEKQAPSFVILSEGEYYLVNELYSLLKLTDGREKST